MIRLGLDIGIASCGWALIDDSAGKIIATGVRIFDKAEAPKTGASLALPRRTARSARRRLKTRRTRLSKLSRYLAELGVIDSSYKVTSNPEVWQLRVEALERSLTGAELITVLWHIGKRRGFRSNRKAPSVEASSSKAQSDNAADDDQKMKAGASQLKEQMINSGKRTVGEYLASKIDSQEKIRNETGTYSHTVLRDLLEDEVRLILQHQTQQGAFPGSPEIINAILDILFSQKPLQSVDTMVGYCEFVPEEKRAPINSVSFERSRCLQKLANLRETDNDNHEPVRITPQMRENVLAHLESHGKVTYAALARILNLSEEHRFRDVNYNSKRTSSDVKKINKQEKFVDAPFMDKLRKTLKNDYHPLLAQRDLLDRIAEILSYHLDDNKRFDELAKLEELNESLVDKLAALSFSRFGHLSFTVLKRIENHLLNGIDYASAMQAAGFNHSAPTANEELDYLPLKYRYYDPSNAGTTSPVVRRALHQATKVVNAITKQYGKPDRVVIELARDLGRSFRDRGEITKDNKKRETENNNINAQLKEINLPTNGESRLKYKLWKEQGCECAYTGTPISQQMLLEPNRLQIDHILPYSRSFDDSYMNKVLVLVEANQEKGNRTPFEWLKEEPASWHRLRLLAEKLPRPKFARIAQNELDDETWKNRNLNDTRHIAREFLNLLQAYYLPPLNGKKRVIASSGRITAVLRRLWGLGLKDRDSHLHHAMDAILIACVGDRTIQNITKFFQDYSSTHERSLRLHLPWEGFRAEALSKVEQIFVSRRVSKKLTGPAHAETIKTQRATKDAEQGTVQNQVYKRVQLPSLKLSDLENILDKERNWKLYKALKERLEEYHNDAAKAFKEPFYIPGKQLGTLGARVKSVLIADDSKSGILIRGQGRKGGGIADNGSMVRVDIFRRFEKTAFKYYMIPVYVHQIGKGVLPTKVCKAHKSEEHWPEIDTSYEFMFSLYPGSYVVLLNQKSGEREEGYYVSAHRGNGSLKFVPASGGDHKQKGIKTVSLIQKFRVDVLGNKREVFPGEETRYGLENRSNRKRSSFKLRERSANS